MKEHARRTRSWRNLLPPDHVGIFTTGASIKGGRFQHNHHLVFQASPHTSIQSLDLTTLIYWCCDDTPDDFLYLDMTLARYQSI